MSLSPDETLLLVAQAQQGSSAAVSHLYETYAPLIYRYVAYRAPDDAVEDLVSSVFLQMVEGLPRYRATGAPFEAWLYRIAAARVADFHRRRARRPQAELDERLPSTAPQPEEQLVQAQEHEQLRAVLGQLNDEQQTVLLLRFVERKSHDEVASILGKNSAAIRTIQHRALTRLAALLGSEEKARHYLRGSDE